MGLVCFARLLVINEGPTFSWLFSHHGHERVPVIAQKMKNALSWSGLCTKMGCLSPCSPQMALACSCHSRKSAFRWIGYRWFFLFCFAAFPPKKGMKFDTPCPYRLSGCCYHRVLVAIAYTYVQYTMASQNESDRVPEQPSGWAHHKEIGKGLIAKLPWERMDRLSVLLLLRISLVLSPSLSFLSSNLTLSTKILSIVCLDEKDVLLFIEKWTFAVCVLGDGWPEQLRAIGQRGISWRQVPRGTQTHKQTQTQATLFPCVQRQCVGEWSSLGHVCRSHFCWTCHGSGIKWQWFSSPFGWSITERVVTIAHVHLACVCSLFYTILGLAQLVGGDFLELIRLVGGSYGHVQSVAVPPTPGQIKKKKKKRRTMYFSFFLFPTRLVHTHTHTSTYSHHVHHSGTRHTGTQVHRHAWTIAWPSVHIKGSNLGCASTLRGIDMFHQNVLSRFSFYLVMLSGND